MGIESVFEVVYYISGVLVAAILLLVVLLLRRERQELVKSRIFLNYGRFKMAFFIAFVGAAAFLLGSLAGLLGGASLAWVHALAEVVYNVSLVCFFGVLYHILRPRGQTV